MRRLMLTVTASALLVALAPASALAKNHHHKRDHKRTDHARVHKAKIRHRRFGDVNMPPAVTPAPPTPGAPPADSVGTVSSFTSNVLTIQLNDGSSVGGMVSDQTEIECEAIENEPNEIGHHDGDRGGDQGPGGGDNSGRGGDNGRGDDNGGGDDHGQDNTENNNNCTTADLTPGAFVRGAELGISSTGAVWDKVDLIL